MTPPIDTIIVGAGLAGACAAWHLSRQQQVLVLEAAQPTAGASGAAAGLANPLTGQRAKAVWRFDEALEALHITLDAAAATSLYQKNGLLRPAMNAKQARVFRKVASTLPQHAAWLSADAARERFPGVVAHQGALLVRHGGAIRVPNFVHTLLKTAQARGVRVETDTQVIGWGEDNRGSFVDIRQDDQAHRRYAQRVLLAMGYGYHQHPELAALNLHPVKGQTVRVTRPAAVANHDLPPLSGWGYVVPDGDTFVLGSSYERGFTNLSPSEEQTRHILAKTSRMLPVLKEAFVLDATAGVRVMVPGTRLPMLGPLPGRAQIWIFTGLGSKGLLMAPLLARCLAYYFHHPEAIPEEIRVH